MNKDSSWLPEGWDMYDPNARAVAKLESGQLDLWDNAESWGPFFWCASPAPRPAFPIAISWVREIGQPFRFGWGIRILGEHYTHTFGIWWHDKKAKPSVVALAPALGDDDDDFDWMATVPPHPQRQKSDKWTWSMFVMNFRLRHKKGQNALQYAWYTWRGHRLAKKAARARKVKEVGYQEWVSDILAGKYDVDGKS